VRLAVGCKSCVRPVDAATLTAGPDVIRGSGPDQNSGLLRHRPSRVFPIDGSTVSHHAIITLALQRVCRREFYLFIAKPLRPVRKCRRVIGFPPLANTAHAIRAILLASATATSFAGRRANSCMSQACFSGWARACRMTAVAPTIRRRRK